MRETESKKPWKVVVVDDDPDMVRIVRLALEMHGFEVLEACNGIKGLLMVKRELPDAVLLDIMMPDIDGFEVCRKLKLDSATSKIPIIFITAKSGQEHVRRGLSLGAQGYITKPFSVHGLPSKVERVIRESS